MDRPIVLLAAQSPAPSFVRGSVVLYRHTWLNHIEPEHIVDLQAVNRTISDPCIIAESRTVPGDWVFVNERDRNADNEVLRVPVRSVGAVTNIVTTAYHTDATYHGKVVWRRGDD